DIPKASGLIVSAIVGLGYELPMNKEKSFLLIPEISFCYGISPFVNGLKWTANSFNIGLSIAYSTAKYKMESPKIEEKVIKGTKLLLAENEIEVLGNPDNLIYASFDIKANETADKILKSEIFADIKAVGISDGAEYPQAVIHVEEFLSLNMRPLLNYVFFENGSTIIPDRYLKLNPEDKGKFEINNLANESTLSTYYQILNIIGKRMQQFPSAILTLVGCNSDNENEKGNKQLSKDRVEAVANYFYKIWGIAQKRIIVKSRNLPESPSNVSVQDGIEENRRVEILSDTYQILDPVITNDTVVKVSPTVIRFKNFVKTTNGVAEWKLQLYEKNKIIKVFSGIDSVPSQQDWFLDKEKKIIPTKTDSISFALEVKDKAGDVQVTKTDFLSIDQQTLKKKQENKAGDKRIDHYCLILFKYNSSELSPANVIITEYIKSNLKNNSKILISGYTDRMGDPNYNIDLSESRAKAISKIINSKNTFIRAVGSNDLLYNNDLPEGRFYSRTVEVEVETPIKW
ncbi:MAG: OmpA family protein, partial [FCB group bacterium]